MHAKYHHYHHWAQSQCKWHKAFVQHLHTWFSWTGKVCTLLDTGTRCFESRKMWEAYLGMSRDFPDYFPRPAQWNWQQPLSKNRFLPSWDDGLWLKNTIQKIPEPERKPSAEASLTAQITWIAEMTPMRPGGCATFVEWQPHWIMCGAWKWMKMVASEWYSSLVGQNHQNPINATYDNGSKWPNKRCLEGKHWGLKMSDPCPGSFRTFMRWYWKLDRRW